MNKIFLYIITIICLSSCVQTETQYTTSAKIYLINETNVVVKSDATLGYVIQPGDTLIHTESNTLDGDRPSVNQYFLSFLENKNIFKYEDNESKCEQKIYSIDYYENKKELEQNRNTLAFEFTFKFNEEKKAEAEICN